MHIRSYKGEKIKSRNREMVPLLRHHYSTHNSYHPTLLKPKTGEGVPYGAVDVNQKMGIHIRSPLLLDFNRVPHTDMTPIDSSTLFDKNFQLSVTVDQSFGVPIAPSI